MEYGRFTASRQGDWQALADGISARKPAESLGYDGLEDFASRYRRVVADFAYARTRFPGSEAEKRVRALALGGHRLLTPPEASTWRRLAAFFATGFPERFRASIPALRVALALFFGGLLLGLVLTTLDDNVAVLFVGADGVDQIRRGEIWTDQLSSLAAPQTLAARIFTNNISVALIAWAGGALFGIGSVWSVTFNGAMVGSIIGVCLRYGMEDRLFAFIPAHGLLELFLITVAGAAGLELARGTLMVGPSGRGAAFVDGARRSLELVGGTLPWFVLLGLVEGYLSPLMDIPTVIKSAVGVLLLGLFLAYALVPLRKAS